MTKIRVIGPGRAGCSLMVALGAAGGYSVMDAYGRAHSLADAACDVDVVVIATPDDAVAQVASMVIPVVDTMVVHLSGSLGLDVLAPHVRRASLHPLVPLPNPEVGAARLRSGVTFAVAGDPQVREIADALGGHVVEVADELRATYHLVATIAANHTVALLGQVERVAALAGLPLCTFAGLVHAAVDDALELGPHDALTGPAARSDWATLDRHRSILAAMPGAQVELAAYDAMVALARRLHGDPTELETEGSAEPARTEVTSGPGRWASQPSVEPVA